MTRPPRRPALPPRPARPRPARTPGARRGPAGPQPGRAVRRPGARRGRGPRAALGARAGRRRVRRRGRAVGRAHQPRRRRPRRRRARRRQRAAGPRAARAPRGRRARCRRGSSSTGARWRSARTTARTSPTWCATSSSTRSRCCSAATRRRSTPRLTRSTGLPQFAGASRRASASRARAKASSRPSPRSGRVSRATSCSRATACQSSADVGLLPPGGALADDVGDPRPVLLARPWSPTASAGRGAADRPPPRSTRGPPAGRAPSSRTAFAARRSPWPTSASGSCRAAARTARSSPSGTPPRTSRPASCTEARARRSDRPRRRLPRLPGRRRQRRDADGGLDRLLRPAGAARRAGVHPAGQQPPAVVGGGEHLRDADPALLGPPPTAQLRLQPQPAVLGHRQVEDPVGQHALDHAEPRAEIAHAEQRLRHPQLGQQGGAPGLGTPRRGSARRAHPSASSQRPAGPLPPGRARVARAEPPCDAGPGWTVPWLVLGVVLGVLPGPPRRPDRRARAAPPGSGPPRDAGRPSRRGRPARLPGVPARLRAPPPRRRAGPSSPRPAAAPPAPPARSATGHGRRPRGMAVTALLLVGSWRPPSRPTSGRTAGAGTHDRPSPRGGARPGSPSAAWSSSRARSASPPPIRVVEVTYGRRRGPAPTWSSRRSTA